MTETQKRIRAYKKALPHMRERVIAVAMLLVISLSMVTSASFAWITLSANPEVSSLTTTVASNGNLEIALSDTDGLEPENSAVGDSYVYTNDVSISNLTWGNLINLSHENYGLDHLVLRPASLNVRDLINSPVYAVDYGSDGRTEGYVTDFAFSSYDKATSKFSVPVGTTKYGVRAISSVYYDDVTGNLFLVEQVDALNDAYTNATSLFDKIYNDKDNSQAKVYMNAIAGLVGIHVSAYLGDDQICNSYMPDLYLMLGDFVTVVEKIADSFVETMNLYLYLSPSMENERVTDYNAIKLETSDIFKVDGTLDSSKLNEFVDHCTYREGESGYDANAPLPQVIADFVATLEEFAATRKDTYDAYDGIEKLYKVAVNDRYADASSKYAVYWSTKYTYEDGTKASASLESLVNKLCDMDTATLNGYTASDLQAMVAQGLDGMLSLLGIVSGDTAAIINDGAIKDVDELLEGKMHVDAGKVKITVTIPDALWDKYGSYAGLVGVTNPFTLQPSIDTSAVPSELGAEITNATQKASGGSNLKGQPYADATYAMAIDLWVRTNASNSLLILEGDVETDDDGNVTGYSGVNRVWDELDDEDTARDMYGIVEGGRSTTQGSGSCYIFYADDPEQQAQSMNMLRAMRVAFVDANGQLLAQAYMDVDMAFEDAGRVVVPLQLYPNQDVTMEDGTTENEYITKLVQNEATRITAIIYLDGEILTNNEVMEAGSIQGQMNIQFGSSDLKMNPLHDEDLMTEFYTIQVVEPSSKIAHWDGYDDETKCKTTLKLLITGQEPKTITGNFISIINNTQGAAEAKFTMSKDSEGYWVCDVPFSGPGHYELRSLQIDGVDVALSEENRVTVEIDGVAVNSLIFSNEEDTSGLNEKSIMTADTYYRQSLTLSLGSSEQHTVRGVFIGDNGQNATVDFSFINGRYTGTATFGASGTYQLTYLEIDGSVSKIDPELYKTMYIQLGLRADVSVSRPVVVSEYEGEAVTEERAADVLKELTQDAAGNWSFKYTAEIPLTMNVYVTLEDDQGNPIENETGINLRYTNGSTQMKTDLEWQSGGYYSGTFLMETNGVFEYEAINLRTDKYITSAASATTLTAISPNPMEYVYQDERPLVYDIGSTQARSLQMQLLNGQAATLSATIVSDQGETLEVGATRVHDEATGVTTFTIPVTKDGQWTITDAKVTNVFYEGEFWGGTDANGETKWLSLDEFVDEDSISTFFLTQVDVEATDYPSVKPYTGLFMEDHIVPDMRIKVTHRGEPLSDVLAELGLTDEITVGMTYKWSGTEGKYGVSDQNNVSAVDRVPNQSFGSTDLTQDEATGNYLLGAMNFQIEGTYNAAFTITIGGTTYSYANENMSLLNVKQNVGLDNNTMVKVAWTRPSVTITGVSPTEETMFDTAMNADSVSDTFIRVHNSYTSTYATVYAQYEDTWVLDDWTLSSVSLEVDYLDVNDENFNSASVVVGNKHGASYANTLSFAKGSKQASGSIGHKANRASLTDGLPTLYYAGKQMVNQILVNYDGLIYTLSLDSEFIINNPLYPPYVELTDISSVDSTFTGTTPDRQYSEDGETVTITLPDDEWVSKEKNDYPAEESITSGPTTTFFYTSRQGGFLGWTTYYTTYDVTTTSYESVVKTEAWTETHKIIEWTDGTNTYTAGETVTITGGAMLRPVIEVTNNNDLVTTTDTKVKTTVTVVTGSESTSRPGSKYVSTNTAPTESDTGWYVP